MVLNGPFVGGGVNHLLVHDHIEIALRQQYLPLICRYEPKKSPAIRHAFFEEQANAFARVCDQAEAIAIIGTYCAYTTDTHIWSPIAKSSAQLLYVDPIRDSQNIFSEWALGTGRAEGQGYKVVSGGFRDAVAAIAAHVHLY